MSPALLDPKTSVFQTPEVNGVLGYRAGWRCAVAIGDPVCAPSDMERLAEAFRAHCRAHHWHTAYAVAGAAFAEKMVQHGYAAIEFGEELILDPRRDPQSGSAGRELRKKIHHAQRESVEVREYDRSRDFNPDLEKAMVGVANSWLEHRKGPQVFLAHVRLFEEPEGRRWFYATQRGKVVGVLATIELDSRGGPLLEHHLVDANAPDGTSEQLVVGALSVLGAEGCAFATFGPAPRSELGRIEGLSPFSQRVARYLFRVANTRFHLDARVHYRKKFQIARTEPSLLLFDPPRVGALEILGIARAFNVSLA